ncbi:MAG: DUF3846 domain-containing protein [Actinomycetota bacterium]
MSPTDFTRIAVVVPANDPDTAYRIDLGPDDESAYRALSAAVGGFIEIVRLSDRVDMVLNEVGKLQGLPVNRVATGLGQSYGGLDPSDVVVGDVVLIGNDGSPETVGLHSDDLADLDAPEVPGG